MKRIVSVSLGSSARDHAVEMELLGVSCRIERIGTNGDVEKMITLIKQLDGQVDAFGLGGIGLHFHTGTKRFTLREAKIIVQVAQRTPIVDGSGLKDLLEGNVVRYMAEETELLAGSPRVLLASGVDRFGMAQALDYAGFRLTLGDLVFIVGLPIPLRSMRSLERMATLLYPR